MEQGSYNGQGSGASPTLSAMRTSGIVKLLTILPSP
jgi:hypothetical protein